MENLYTTMLRNILVAFFLCSSFVLSAQHRNEKLINKLMEQQRTAWNKGNLEGFMATYWNNDSLMFIGKSGVTYGWKNTLENYKKGYPDATAMGTLDFKIIQIQRLASKYYSVTGKWHLERSIGDLQGHFTLLLRKIKNQWHIVKDHSS